ncbi:MAG: hypothetical protein OHK0039_10660 [Bacteroidia bacterium]
MNKSTQQFILLIGGVLLFILLFSLCNPFRRDVLILEDPRVDRFVQQDAASQVDILWVVDNSGSMESSQLNLAQNFDRFIDNFTAQSAELLDFQMAVITTDPGEQGRFVGDQVLRRSDALSDQAAFMERFRALVQVGTAGSGEECGLLGMSGAIRQPGQRSFFRPEALLIVNILTDEPDQSTRQSGRQVTDFVEEVRTFKQHRRVMINTIADTSGYGNIRRMAQYNELIESLTGQSTSLPRRSDLDLPLAATLTQGIVADIRGNFATSLANLGSSIAELARSFALTRQADGDQRMIVFVDGEEIDPGYWVYDPGLNLVRFTEDYVPEPGAQVEIHYEVFHDFGQMDAGLEQ